MEIERRSSDEGEGGLGDGSWRVWTENGGRRRVEVRGPGPKPTNRVIAVWWLDVDVPLEFVREVARARAVAEAGHVEGGAAARHGGV